MPIYLWVENTQVVHKSNKYNLKNILTTNIRKHLGDNYKYELKFVVIARII